MNNTLNAKGRLAVGMVRHATGWLLGGVRASAHHTMQTNIRKKPPYLNVTPTEVQWITEFDPVVYNIDTNTTWFLR